VGGVNAALDKSGFPFIAQYDHPAEYSYQDVPVPPTGCMGQNPFNG